MLTLPSASTLSHLKLLLAAQLNVPADKQRIRMDGVEIAAAADGTEGSIKLETLGVHTGAFLEVARVVSRTITVNAFVAGVEDPFELTAVSSQRVKKLKDAVIEQVCCRARKSICNTRAFKGALGSLRLRRF
jgi:hypothetical protein